MYLFYQEGPQSEIVVGSTHTVLSFTRLGLGTPPPAHLHNFICGRRGHSRSVIIEADGSTLRLYVVAPDVTIAFLDPFFLSYSSRKDL